MWPEPEPPEGDYWDSYDPDPEPLTCERCGAVHDDFDNWCEECGALVGLYARLKEAGMLEAYMAYRTPDPENAPF